MPSSTYYAVLLALVMGVGCGKKGERLLPPEPPKAVAEKLITDPIVEKEIRRQLKKPTGELTKADLEKVKSLNLDYNQLTNVKDLEKLTQLTGLSLNENKLTDVKGLEKLTQLKTLKLLSLAYNQLTDVKGLEKLTNLERLYLSDNPDLTKSQIAELQKALPKCKIHSDFD